MFLSALSLAENREQLKCPSTVEWANVASLYIGRLHGNGKEGATSTRSNTGDSHNIMLNTKGIHERIHSVYESIYPPFKTR